MNDRQRAPRHDQAAIRGARERGHDALDLACIAYAEGAYLHPQRRRHGLDGAPLAKPGGQGGIANDRRSRHVGRDLFEQLQPFTADAILPPGRARLSTKPAPTGSGVPVNTIGTVRVACSSDGTTAPPPARMTSGASATNSDACLRKSSASPAPQRYSIRTLRPTVHPNSCRPCRNAALRACPSASSEPRFMSTPIRRTLAMRPPFGSRACAATTDSNSDLS